MARQYGQNSEKGQIARAQKMQELEEEMLFKHKVERYVALGLLVVGALFVIFGIVSAGSYKVKTEDTRKELQETQAKLAELEEAKLDEDTTVVEVETVAASAADAGTAVCVAQNDLNAALKAERAMGMEVLSEEHQDALNRLRLYFVKEGNATTLRGTWCDCGTWYFNGLYAFEGNTITVVWKCYAPDDVDKDRLLAFVKADYDAHSNTFTHGEIRLTSWYKTVADELGELTTPVQDPSITEPTEHYDPNADNSGATSSSSTDPTAPSMDDGSYTEPQDNNVTVHTGGSNTSNEEGYQEVDAYGNPIN